MPPLALRRSTSIPLLALATLGCATVSGAVRESEGNRALLLLSDKPAPRRGCSILFEPATLPTLSQLADSAALAAAVREVAERTGTVEPISFALLSVALDQDGSIGSVHAFDWWLPPDAPRQLEMVVRAHLRAPGVGSGNIRLRVEPTTGVLRVGRSERCLPIETTRFSLRMPAVAAPLKLQPAVIRVRVLADGSMAGSTMLRRTGSDEMDRFILARLAEHRYGPGTIDGRPVVMDYEQTVRVQQR